MWYYKDTKMDQIAFQDRKNFLQKAEAYLERGLLQTALDMAKARLADYPGDIDARAVICQVWIKMDMPEKAEEVLSEVIDYIQGIAHVCLSMAEVKTRKGYDRQAIDHYRKFIALSTDEIAKREASGEVERLLAICAETKGAACEESYDTIREIASDFHTMTMADLYLKQGHTELATDVLSEILKRDPDNAEAAERLRAIKAGEPERTMGATLPAGYDQVIAELSSWLAKISRVRSHA